jgi:hypothetical protein
LKSGAPSNNAPPGTRKKRRAPQRKRSCVLIELNSPSNKSCEICLTRVDLGSDQEI